MKKSGSNLEFSFSKTICLIKVPDTQLFTEIAFVITAKYTELTPPTGVEPAIPGLGSRCRIHWATEAYTTAYSEKTWCFLIQ